MRDPLDGLLMNLLQQDFPVCPEPYKVLGEQLGISEQEALERTRRLKENGYIRRLGGVFDSGRLGYVSVLCAAQVAPDDIPAVTEAVNRCIGVTHNYLRQHDYNVWFTVTAESEARRDAIVDELESLPGIQRFMRLPAVARYKIRAVFDMQGVTADE